MKQCIFDDMDIGRLPNGDEIGEGDLVMCKFPQGTSFTDVVICDGRLCIRDNFFWGQNVPIDHILGQASYYEIKKVSLVDIYKFCKKHGWGFYYYAEKFRKR